MNLEGILLSEISQAEKAKYHINSLICEIQKQTSKKPQHPQTNKKTKLMGIENKLVVARGSGEGRGCKMGEGC